MGPPGWGPPPPGGWGPPPPGGWPPPPEDWDPIGAPPPGGWGPRGPLPPGGWGPRGPLPHDWDPRGPPPPDWHARRPPPPDWDPRGPPHPGWGPEDWDWDPRADYWRLPHFDADWRGPRDDWGPDRPLPPPGWGPPGWDPEGPPEPWGPEAGPPAPVPPVGPPVVPPVVPPGIPPVPPVGMPPPDPAAFGPPVAPPGCMPPFGFPPAYPPPGWTGEPVVEEPLPNPPPDQPEWIKALISAPATDSTASESKKPSEDPSEAKNTPAAEPDPITPAAAPTAPPPKPKPELSTISKALGLLGKRTFEKPPPGRSTGIISFIGPTFGYIMREDLEKFTFSFDAFFGNPKAMTAGVRVHFTACKEKNSSIATDVKVAPGGTENLDPEIYEAVVCQPIVEPQPGERQYPGQVYVTIGPVRRNLPFDRRDSTVTLLKNDQVLINLLTDIVSEKTRATNIKPKIPGTFSHTKEIREKGVIISLKDKEGIIKLQDDTELPFEAKENFSDVEFTQEDVNEEVEFTVVQLRAGKRAVRIQRAKEPLLLTLCTATAASDEEDKAENDDSEDGFTKPLRTRTKQEIGPNVVLDTELYEGIVSQTIIDPKPGMPGYPGQIHANIGTVRTNVTFDHRDCGVTLLKNDHVLINLLIDAVTRKRRAANIKPKVPFTFKYTKEERELGIITSLGPEVGVLKSEKHGELPFDICENFSDTEFNRDDIHKEVEFTTIKVKSKTRAIRLKRMKKIEDPILYEQKKREEERKEEEERRRREEEERKKREEEEREREAERKKKEEVAAALAAAKDKWTPLGFKIRDPDTQDDISKERFEGTVLKSISRNPLKVIRKEPEKKQEENKGGGDAGAGQVQIKVEKTDEVEKGGAEGRQEVKLELKKEKVDEDVTEDKPAEAAEVGTKLHPEVGRLVMTIDGQQKQLTFGPKDLLTTATMLDGDKVRFNIATHQKTKEERATYVEILPDSFEESIEQRQHGIVIEFLEDSGLIKCTQNPQLYFHMSEVIEKKKLELNEKVEFSIVPHETAEGRVQAIRIKRYTESVFFPVRKLGGVGANKGKMTIKLTKASEEKDKPEAEKLKAVVKNLRAQDSKTNRRDYSTTRRRYSRSKSRSRSRSPPRDQFGRVKKRRSSSVDRERRSSKHKQSHERSHGRTRSRSKSRSRSRSQSKSSSRSRSRSRERSKDRASKRKSKISRDREESHKRRRELSPPPRRAGIVDDELARKKRELEELNEMIAYKKSLVDIDPRGLEPGQRTCIDYDHGRIAVPLAEYKPVRSILKKRPEGPEYLHRPPYDDPYYDRPYSPYQDRRYGDRYGDPYASRPYAEHSYGDRPFAERPFDSRLYSEPPYSGPLSSSHRYTDRYDVYDEPYDDRYYDQVYVDRPYDPYPPAKQSHSPEPSGLSPPSHSDNVPASSVHPPLSHSAATSSSQTSFRPPSPIDSPPRSPSPKLKDKKPRLSPPAEKPPLDRFLDMLNKKVDAEKKSGPVHVNDDLLPHERALQDGKGFSRIVGLSQEPSSISRAQEVQKQPPSPKRSSVEKTSEEPKTEPYEKIQSLLRTIGLKLSTGEVSKLASQAQEQVFSPRSSTERETSSAPREELRPTRTSSLESDRIHSPSPVRSSSLEPLSRQKTNVSEYEDFLDQQELETFKKAQQLQNLTKTIGSTPSTTPSPKPPPGPPPAHYRHPTPPFNWPLGVTTEISPTQTSTSTMVTPVLPAAGQQFQKLGQPPGPPPGPPPRRPGQSPPGPPPGPPPRRPFGQPPFSPPSSQSVLPFIGGPDTVPPSGSTGPSQHLTTTVVLQPSSALRTSSPVSDDHSAISTTVARCLKVIETVKSLTVQPPLKPVKSVQFSLPTESPSVETEDDIKTKQKEKLDLYNQRLLEKRDQEYKELLARKKQGEMNKDGSLISSGKLVSREPRNVWIVGHSLVYWAESRAKSPEVGMQLGMDPSKVTIWWKGTQGMTWSQLLPQLHQLKVTWPNPDVLILHLGGNDLSTDSPTDLLGSVKKDLMSMRSIFPQCILVWSNILPRRVWRHSADSHEVDLVRTTVNRRIQNIISELGGASLTHENIRCGTNTGLYRVDGVHLSQKGIDVFNLNLQDFLEKWEMEVNAASEKS